MTIAELGTGVIFRSANDHPRVSKHRGGGAGVVYVRGATGYHHPEGSLRMVLTRPPCASGERHEAMGRPGGHGEELGLHELLRGCLALWPRSVRAFDALAVEDIRVGFRPTRPRLKLEEFRRPNGLALVVNRLVCGGWSVGWSLAEFLAGFILAKTA